MNSEYTLSTGTKVLYYISAGLMLIVGLFLFTVHSNIGKFGLIFPVFFLAGATLIVINIKKRKIIITDDDITHSNVFRSKQILFRDIKGCRVGQKVIYIVSNTQQAPNITITNYIDFVDSEGLSKWFKQNFRDLNAEDYEADFNNILNDSKLGISEDERRAALSQARVIGYSYNIIGIILLILSFFIKNSVVF